MLLHPASENVANNTPDLQKMQVILRFGTEDGT